MIKKIFIAVVSGLLIFVFGIMVGIKLTNENLKFSFNKNNTFQAGWEAAKQRLNQSNFAFSLPSNAEIKNISGIIQKIEGNKITLKINPLEPLADPALDIRIVAIDSNTKINLAVQKDQAQFDKEMKEFNEKISKPQTDATQPLAIITPPSQIYYKEIKQSDLKEKQSISIMADENIKDKKEFTAVQIDAQEVIEITPSAQIISNEANPIK